MLSAREVDSRIEYLTAVSDLYGPRYVCSVFRDR